MRNHITAFVVSMTFCHALVPSIIAQKKSPPATVSPLCTRDNALDTIKQQMAATKTFDNTIQRITVLLRAADMLWPYQREKALATFIEAFDLATQNFREMGDEPRRDPTARNAFALVLHVPDQRYKVIAALSRRDPAAARKLSEKLLQEEAAEAADKPSANTDAQIKTAEKLLAIATDLVPGDQAAAIAFARSSFRFPANFYLPRFLFTLAKENKVAADQVYQEAISAYSTAAMDQFLYLSSYPFGNTREAGEMPSTMFYIIPEGFVPNTALQRVFVQKLLSRIQLALEAPVEASASSRYSDPAQMWLALGRLEKQINESLPELSDAALQAKDKLYALLAPTSQRQVNGLIDRDNRPKTSFDQQVEAAEKLADVGRRDQGIVFAVIGVSANETVEHVVSAIDKISESSIRDSLSNWFFLFRTQSLIKDKKFSEARTLAAKVTELDGRAYLYSRIAEESLKDNEDQTEAREMLNEIANATAKAPKTIVAARSLLALSFLYAKIDVNRGIEELANAVRVINSLESPDFSNQYVPMKIEGKTFSSFAGYSTPGFNPENAFREMGKLDFDGSLNQAASFTDKSLRSLTTLALIEPCLLRAAKKAPSPR